MPGSRLARLALIASGVFSAPAAIAQTTLDEPTIQSRYDATPSGGTIAVATGQWPAAAWGAPFSPTKTDAQKSVLWNFSTATPPRVAVGDNDVTQSFWGGHVNFLRKILTGDPGNATLFLGLDDFSRDYQPIHYNGSMVGEFADVPALQVNATTHAGSRGQLNGIEVILDSQGDNAAASEDQGLDIKVNKSGQNSTWALSTMSNDTSGRPPQAFATIGIEDDLLANGPDGPISSDPEAGNRIFLWLVGKVSPVPAWTAGKKIAAGDRVLGHRDGAAAVYVATGAGTTGPAAPAWPGAGTVADGGVTWSYGEPYAVSFGRGIALDSQRGQPVSFATGFSSNAAFTNAVIDLSAATLARPGAAAIRLAAGMPVDFSGNATAAGQNRHTLGYAAGGLGYAVAGHPVLTITDAGHIATAGATPTLSACGGGAVLSRTASDRHGTVTPGAGACTINFATAYASPPDCLLTGFSAAPTYIRAVTTTALTVSSAARFTYLCEQ